MWRLDRRAVTSTKKSRSRTTRLLVGVLGTALVIFIATSGFWLSWLGNWLAMPPNLQHADAIVVLGGNPDRADRAIMLYRQGFATEFWHTGDAIAPGNPSAAQKMAQRAVARGVPQSAIHLLTTTSTWEDGREIAALARERKVRSILVVTNWYHSRRALCVIGYHLRGSGVRIYYDSPVGPRYGPNNWWRYKYRRQAVLDELIKIVYYWLRYGVSPWSC